MQNDVLYKSHQATTPRKEACCGLVPVRRSILDATNDRVVGVMGVQKGHSKDAPRWFSTNPSKRWGEIFFLKYSIVWILIFGGVVVTEIYKTFGDVEFMALGLIVALPCVLYPLFFPSKEDAMLPLRERYWVKANIWIFFFGFVGNYFWTHYFFVLLKATYRFPVTWNLNEVPICLYLVTHAYFISYHSATTPILRRFWTATRPGLIRTVGSILLVLVLAYITAFMEAWTLEKVPYYHIEDRRQMYLVGSTFYMLYFIISFPMFTRIDETGDKWNLSRASLESLGSAMIVFILCDFWRLLVGGLSVPGATPTTSSLPFLKVN
eukprot:Phypoly_transcript_03565.p1 GENE.Phypoly_transcript_03565~~Phypoly_transcript_03565.p1  ORF type:complete len:322 (+),score=42.13 Phypoly_transcript_03565:311-1276(+)